ncbi:MAG: TolC family protein [Ferruginibacter sp.]
MKKQIKWYRPGVALLFCCMAAFKTTAQSQALGIKTAIETAMTNNRSLRADSFSIAAAGSKTREIAGLFLPQVNYSSSTEYNPAIASQLLPGAMVGEPGKEYVPVKFGTRYNLRNSVEVNQTIYRKDLKLQVKEAAMQIGVAQTRYTLSKEELVYQVSIRYYALQTNAELIRTTRFDYLNMKEVLDIAKGQYENGVLKKVDYESLQINVANMLSQLNQLQTEYKGQLAYFNYLLGLPAAAETVISDTISEELHAVTKTADNLAQRNDIRLIGQQVMIKENELKRIQAEKSAAFNSYFRFNLQSQFNNVDKAFDNDYMFKSSAVGITVTMPLFDGGRRKHRSNAVAAELEQLKLDSRYKQEQAQMELVTANNTFGNNREEYSITKENLLLATNLFNSRKALYTEGVSTLMELLDAERELSKARNNHMQALINVQTGWLDLHKAKGTLLTDFIKSI